MTPSLSVTHVQVRDMTRWQDAVRENFLPLEFSGGKRAGFAASLIGRSLGGAHLACVSTEAYRVQRTHKLAAQSEQRYFKLFWQIDGSSSIEQAGRTSTLAAGAWTFYDTSRPYAIESSNTSRFAVMLLPQSHCPSWKDAVAERVGEAFRASGASRVALASVMTALRDPEEYDVLGADSVVGSISALMLAALQARSAASQPAVRARLSQARRYIADRIDDPGLTPDEVAAALHVSRRTLYAWFAQHGESPAAFIQQTRLEQCRLALIDPGRREHTITRIAFDNGFTDMAHFSRLFKHAYDAGPRDYRKRLAG